MKNLIKRTAGAATLVALLASLAVVPSADAATYYACVKKKTGAIRIVSRAAKCKRRERKISFNSQGVPGSNGKNGRNGSNGRNGANGSGTTGAQGQQGPQGPGAMTITRTVEKGAGEVTLATLSNGLSVTAVCGIGGNASVVIETTDHSENFQGSGTISRYEGGLKLTAVAVNGSASGLGFNSEKEGGVDVIARDTRFANFARIDFHGVWGSPNCTFWGMIIPSG